MATLERMSGDDASKQEYIVVARNGNVQIGCRPMFIMDMDGAKIRHGYGLRIRSVFVKGSNVYSLSDMAKGLLGGATEKFGLGDAIKLPKPLKWQRINDKRMALDHYMPEAQDHFIGLTDELIDRINNPKAGEAMWEVLSKFDHRVLDKDLFVSEMNAAFKKMAPGLLTAAKKLKDTTGKKSPTLQLLGKKPPVEASDETSSPAETIQSSTMSLLQALKNKGKKKDD